MLIPPIWVDKNNGIYTDVVANTKKRKPSTYIERETKLKSPHTNSTFGFCRHTKKPTLKNQKSYFFAHARSKNEYLADFEL